MSKLPNIPSNEMYEYDNSLYEKYTGDISHLVRSFDETVLPAIDTAPPYGPI